MNDLWAQQLHEWQNFYLLVGTAAATLTGLMFVVVSLGAPIIGTSEAAAGVRTFVSPTMVYFTTLLVLSALMLVPVLPTLVLSGMMVLGGLGGLVYLFVSGVHAQWLRSKLGLDDWCWYIGLPGTSSVLLLLAGWGVEFHAVLGLQSVALAALLLIITGIRNAWDIALWVAQRRVANDM